MVSVWLGSGYHLYRSFGCAQPYRYVAYGLWAAAIACYSSAIRNGLNHNFNAAAWWHAVGLHAIGNMGCCVLYCGLHTASTAPL